MYIDLCGHACGAPHFSDNYRNGAASSRERKGLERGKGFQGEERKWRGGRESGAMNDTCEEEDEERRIDES